VPAFVSLPAACRRANGAIPLGVILRLCTLALCHLPQLGIFLWWIVFAGLPSRGVWEPSAWRVLLASTLALLATVGHGRLLGGFTGFFPATVSGLCTNNEPDQIAIQPSDEAPTGRDVAGLRCLDGWI